MKQSSYKDRDFSFRQMMLTLRSTIGLTQTGLANFLGVSRRAIGDWEAGRSYPKPEHFKEFIALAVKHRAFQAGHEAEEIRALWKAARQKVLLNESWLAALLAMKPAEVAAYAPVFAYSQREHDQSHSRKTAIKVPSHPTSFIGRVAELAEIAQIITDSTCRLLTLLGPGGVGKTRLAMQVAEVQADKFVGGVAFVALASVSSANQIISAIGDTLNLSFAGQSDPMRHLLKYLGDRHMLLILDNFEHLMMGADLVFEILQNTLHTKFLITSRERLNLQLESIFDVEGLTYPPEATDLENVADLGDYSAVQLFVQRARQVQPEFPLSKSALITITRICQRVAGMPLAVELAAAGVRMRSLAEIDRQIHSNLDALATTLRDVPERHRSLRAVFDHSCNDLNEPAQALFNRLSVFRGGCTAEAAEKVAQATLPMLMTLVDKSLLRHDAVERRFFLLEPIREYAWEKLATSKEIETTQRAHATYYLALAETVAARWDSPTADLDIEQLDREYDNMHTVLEWSRDGGDLTSGLRLANALRKFWQRRGYYSEGRTWLEELLALDVSNSDRAAMVVRLHALHTAAWLASDQHDFSHAERLFRQSMMLRRTLGENEDDTHLLAPAARRARAAGQYQRATELLEDALVRQRTMGDRGSASTGGLGQTFYELALVFREQSDFAHAQALFKEGLNFHHTIGEQEGIAIGLMGLGDVARDRGDAAQLRHYSEQSLAISRDLGIQWAIGFALNNLALAAYLEGDLAQAYTISSQSVALFRSMQADASLAEVLVTEGHILRKQGNRVAAHEALAEAMRLAWGVGPRLMLVAALEGLACLMTQPEEAALAVKLLSVTSFLRTQMGTPLRPIDQPAVKQTLDIARSSLDADAFAAAWAATRELTLEQILSDISFDTFPPDPQILR